MKTVLLLVMILVQISLTAEPPSNTIPVIGQRFTWWEYTTRFLCDLAWRHFDGFEFEVSATQDTPGAALLEKADSCCLLGIITPSESYDLSVLGEGSRAHFASLTTGGAYIEANENGSAITGKFSAGAFQDALEGVAGDLVAAFSGEGALWCWKLMDEAPTSQRGRMFSSSYPFDQYFPNMFPCQFPADTSMLWTDSASVYSWMKWTIEHEDELHPATTVFAGMPYIESWAGNDDIHDSGVPTAHIHSNIVRAFCNMRYQDYPLINPSVFDNFPEMLQIDIYPFRHVGTEYQEDSSYTPFLGDSLNTWLLDHAETGMDSTFIPALDEGVPVHYFPQAFGMCGGNAMWDTTASPPVLYYWSYNYRIPTPAEFRMLCSIALLHQAKGIFPYCLPSYTEGSGTGQFNAAALLDLEMIPFDAPFEEWAYQNREQDSLSYIRPDCYPPFIDGFDPLYEGPGLPPGTSGERGREAFLEWKFAPYGRLWNSMERTLGAVATVAPELAGLSWWEHTGHPGLVSIECNESETCESWALPECRVFTDSTEERFYLFYVNRCCRDSSHTFSVGFVYDSLTPPSVYALDHDRRVIIPQADLDEDEFSFEDTLLAGEARLVELIPSSIDAELRIASPDVYARVDNGPALHEFAFTAGETVEIDGTFYNLGTDDAADIEVVLTDLTTSTVLGRDTLDFAGLDLDGYEPDDATATFTWNTDPEGDIGVHLLEIEADQAGSEDRRDNAVSVPFLIEPRDYATEVRGDPWDMTEDTANPPAWKTRDIEAVAGDWLTTTWTDSVGGMFEGAVDPESRNDPIPGDISLSIPSDTARWIDGDEYCMLSLAGVWYTPYQSSGALCGIRVYWKDEHGTVHGPFDLDGGLSSGWNTYKRLGPFDLRELGDDDEWSGNLIQELWLNFRATPPTWYPCEDPIWYRLGWVRLAEAVD